MRNIYLKFLLLTLLLSFKTMSGFGHRDTTILVKFHNEVLPNIPLDSLSINLYTSLNSLDNLLISYNATRFKPAYSKNVINQDLKSYYSINIDGIVSNFISDIDELNLTSKIVVILPDSLRLYQSCSN